MCKFIISIKDKTTGRDVMTPYIVSSLDGISSFASHIHDRGLVLLVDPIREYETFVSVPFSDVPFDAPVKQG